MYERYKALKIDRRGPALWLTLRNPPLNAMTDDLHRELSTVFRDISRDGDTRVVVLTGDGDRAFSAGGDVRTLQRMLDDAAAWREGLTEQREIILGIIECEKPVIARVNGHAMGAGANFALACDITVVVENARIADTHVKVGLAAGDGGALLWPHLIGLARARKYMFSGEPVLGREAEAIGLVTEAVAPAELDAAVDRWVRRLGHGPAVAINATKRALNAALRQEAQSAMDLHLGLESLSQQSKDHQIAIQAFLDKSEPQFIGE